MSIFFNLKLHLTQWNWERHWGAGALGKQGQGQGGIVGEGQGLMWISDCILALGSHCLVRVGTGWLPAVEVEKKRNEVFISDVWSTLNKSLVQAMNMKTGGGKGLCPKRAEKLVIQKGKESGG